MTKPIFRWSTIVSSAVAVCVFIVLIGTDPEATNIYEQVIAFFLLLMVISGLILVICWSAGAFE